MTARARPAPQTSGRPAMTPLATTMPQRRPAARSSGCSGSAMTKYSRRATATTAMMKPAKRCGGRYSVMSQIPGMASAAVRSRVRSTSGPRAPRPCLGAGPEASEILRGEMPAPCRGRRSRRDKLARGYSWRGERQPPRYAQDSALAHNTFWKFCRAGFAGRGTALALGTKWFFRFRSDPRHASRVAL